MSGRLVATRGRLGWLAIRLARWLLDVRPSDGDFDTCVYCGAAGCKDGTAEHPPECPQETRVFPVALRDMWPGGPACCPSCDVPLWPGARYTLVPARDGLGLPFDGAPVYEVRCLGCAALEACVP